MTEIKKKRGRPRKVPLTEIETENLNKKPKRKYRKASKEEVKKITDLQEALDKELPEIKLKGKALKSLKKGLKQAKKKKFVKNPPNVEQDLKELETKPTKIKRIKLCPCGKEVGRKVRACKDCGHKFEFKKVGRYEEISDWKKLKEGSIIYLRKGSRGPYYMGEKGKILMGYRGKFTIKHVIDNGLEAYGGEGFAFIYMGPTKFSEDTGIYSRRYRLYKKT